MPSLGLSANLIGSSNFLLSASAQQVVAPTIPVATTNQVVAVGFSEANMSNRVDLYNFSIPLVPMIKINSAAYVSQSLFNNVSFNDKYPEMQLTYTSGVWTLNYRIYNYETEGEEGQIWTASGTANEIPVTGWTGGLNSATGEIEIVNPNSFDFTHAILDAAGFQNNFINTTTPQTSFNESNFTENYYVYSSSTPTTISSLFNENFLRQSTLISSSDIINVYSNVLMPTQRLYRVWFGGGIWRVTNNILPTPPASVADYPVVQDNLIYINRRTAGDGSPHRYMKIKGDQRVFKRAFFKKDSSSVNTINITDPLGNWSATYTLQQSYGNVNSNNNRKIWSNGGYLHLIQAGNDTDQGFFSNWTLYHSDSNASIVHFSSDPDFIPACAWQNVINSSYQRIDLSVDFP